MASHARRPALVPERFGAQAERTEMAWVRTTLASAGLAATAARLLVHESGLALVVGLGVLVALPGLVASWWRTTGLRSKPQPAPARSTGVALVAFPVAIVDLAVIVVLLGR